MMKMSNYFELYIGSGVLLEKLDRFYHLGDMLNANGGCDSAAIARVGCAGEKFESIYLF